MAHAMSITDGTTTFSLSTTNSYLQRYVPVEPTKDDTSVTETIDVTFYGASTAAMQTAMQTLGRLFDTMRRRRALGVGPVVYLQWQPDGDATTWRSQLLDARIEYQDDTLSVFGQAKMPASISLERAPFWEGALTQLPLTNANGTNNTSGLTIWNHDDSGTGHDNYVQIAAADVAGTIPSPVKVELTNNTGGSLSYDTIYMATNAFADPANFAHILEAESALATGGSVASDATCSNGSHVTQALSLSNMMALTLSSSLLQKAAGHDFHLLMRLDTQPAVLYCRPEIRDTTYQIPLRRGTEVEIPSLGSALIDLGVIALPPGGYATTWGAQSLVLNWRSPSAQTIGVDFIALFPAVAFRRLYCTTATANNAKLTDDPIEDRAYMTTSSVDTPSIVRRGGPVMVWPNTLQRIYFLWDNTGINAPIDMTFSVKAWYRPRRLSF